MAEKLAVDGGKPVCSEKWPMWPSFRESTIKKAMGPLRSGQVNYWTGTKGMEFEQAFADWCGAKYGISTANGTTALHVALAALGIGPGDEVIVPSYSFIASSMCVAQAGAIPVFCDTRRKDHTIDPKAIEAKITRRTRGIIPVHLFGNPCDMDAIVEIARRHNLRIIEDTSQAYGAMYKGRRCGTIGDIGAFSLQQSKHITTGDGGLTISDDDELGERIHLFGNKGWPDYSAAGARDYPIFGVCYRMNELTAAVGLAQLRKLDRITAGYNWAGDLLTEKLQGIAGLTPPITQPDGLHTYWHFPLRINEQKLGMSKERFADAVTAEGANCSAGYIGCPIFMYEALRNKRIYGETLFPFASEEFGSGHHLPYEPGYCPEAERALNEMVCLGVNQYFSEQDIQDMADIAHKVAASV